MLKMSFSILKNEIMEQMTSICDMVGQYMQKKEKDKLIAEEQAAKARYWKIPICYDDDDDEESSIPLRDIIISGLPPCVAITPVLSTEEPVDSLIMKDEHLDTILAMESDEVIKSSVEDLVQIPSKSEGIPDKMCDVPFRDNSPPLDISKDQFEGFSDSNDDSTSIYDNYFSIDEINYVKASPSDSELVSLEEVKDFHTEDGEIEDDILQETNTFDNSIPESETFYFDLEENSSGSTTTQSDISLSKYDSFIFDLSNDPFLPADRSDFYHEEFADELAHIIYLSEYECFILKVSPIRNPYELFRGRTPTLSFMRPFGCHVTILNTLDHLGKFDGKSIDGFFVGYSLTSDGPKWLFDIDSIIKSMNYVPVVAGTNSNDFAGLEESNGACHTSKETEFSQDYIVMPLWKDGLMFDSSSKNSSDDEPQPFSNAEKKDDEGVSKASGFSYQEQPKSSTLNINTAGPSINTNSANFKNGSLNINTVSPTVITTRSNHSQKVFDMFSVGRSATLKATHADLFGDETEIDMSNLTTTYQVPTTPNTKIHKDHSLNHVIGELVIEAIRLFLAYASFIGFMVYQMDVKSSFLYGTIKEEVYVCQPPGFEDPNYPNKVYKVVKALYGLHQAPRAWYGTLTKYLLDNGFQRGKIEFYSISGNVKHANEVLVTKGALKSEVGHLDMIEHEVGRLCDDYAWWKLTRRCWNTHVLSTADMNQKERMWLEFWPRNGMVVLGIQDSRKYRADLKYQFENMMGELDIDTLTIKQYLMLTQGNHAPGMVKTRFRGMMEKDIEDMTIAEYMEYGSEMERQSWRNARSYFPT
ncbi:putative ribonuclease H-like domain-containing protein [Tanacetum coccineum]